MQTTGFTISGTVRTPCIPGIAASDQIVKHTSQAQLLNQAQLKQTQDEALNRAENTTELSGME